MESKGPGVFRGSCGLIVRCAKHEIPNQMVSRWRCQRRMTSRFTTASWRRHAVFLCATKNFGKTGRKWRCTLRLEQRVHLKTPDMNHESSWLVQVPGFWNFMAYEIIPSYDWVVCHPLHTANNQGPKLFTSQLQILFLMCSYLSLALSYWTRVKTIFNKSVLAKTKTDDSKPWPGHLIPVTSFFQKGHVFTIPKRVQTRRIASCWTLPETNGEFTPESLLVGRRSFPFGALAYFQVRTVSFREGNYFFLTSTKNIKSLLDKTWHDQQNLVHRKPVNFP